MIIAAKVKTNARENSVTESADGSFIIKTTVPPIDGKANTAIIKLLAKHLKVAQSTISLKSGSTSKNKLFLISG